MGGPGITFSADERRIIYQLVYRVVMADDRLTEGELDHLSGLYTALGITVAERRKATLGDARDVPVTSLVSALSVPARYQLRNALMDAAWVDRVIHRNESKVIVAAVADLLAEDR